MKTTIKTAISDMYTDVALSSDELEEIRGATAHNPIDQQAEQIETPKKLHAYSITAIACTVMISLLSWFTYPLIHQYFNKTEAIIADVIDNHLLHKALEYNTNSLAELRNEFAYLGVMLTQPGFSDGSHGKLIGARPCFILNIPAAQLRYEKNAYLWTTVFQTRYQKNIYGPIPDIKSQHAPLVKIKRGVKVSLWRDGGLLFAVAQQQLE